MTKKVQRSNMTQTDSKGKVLREPRDNAVGEAINFRWWKLDESEMANAIAGTLKFIQQHQSGRMEQLTVSTRLYGNNSPFSLLGTAFTRASSVNSNPASQRITYNVCQSIIETLVAKMAKNKVIPTYITNGGQFEVQKQAKQLTKFAQGLCYQEKIHEKAISALRDGGAWGDGFNHIFRKGDKLCIERTVPHEIFVDMIESLTSDPRQLHRVKIMDRDIALDMFPELEENIATVQPAPYLEIGGQGTAADLIVVTESWHLKSGPKAKDGVHVISIGDGAVADKYDKDYFPFAHFAYPGLTKLLGWYGQGICERQQNTQGEINRCMILKQRSLWMQGSFKVLLENGSKVVSQHLNNDVGAILHYTGTPPQYITPPATNPELQQWIDSLIDKAYRAEGISQLSAAGEKPLGVESGKAMRTLTDIEDDRFQFVEQQLQDYVLEIVRQSIEVVKDIYKDKGEYEVVFPDTRFIETIKWGDIKLEESQYVLKAYPTSSLSDDITGRLAEVQELAQAGWISPRAARNLMAMPDIEMSDNLANAAEDLLHKIFEAMLDDGEYEAPETLEDLELAKTLVLQYYNYAKLMNAPEDRLELLRRFNADLAQPVPAIPAPGVLPGGPMGQPQANPSPAPISNLIPNVPQPAA